ncbi:urotensin-2-like [Lampris incognitus]|uniref:urotensin-2-like n=1 Tax=Lampris incognitus TaxID=2546036 RepID=UPI0024B4F5B0|nr:urotensin-2-like [Lampris incognitus]
MKCSRLLSLTVLLVAPGRLWAHPIADPAEMPYSGPVSVEDRGLGALEDLSLSDQNYAPQDGPALKYTSLVSGELNRDAFRTTGLLPRGMKREVLLEKQSSLSPFSHFLGIRKQFQKRGVNTECFWKYCV